MDSHCDYTKLNDEANLNPGSSSGKDQPNVHHRTFDSGRQAPNSGSTTQDNNPSSSNQNQSQGQSRKNELSSNYTYFYGALFAINILADGFSLLVSHQAASLGLGLNPMEYLATALSLTAVITALMGLCNKDLGKIENAIKMMKIHFPFFVITKLGKVLTAVSVQNVYGVNNSTSIIGLSVILALAWHLCAWYGSMFLPATKIRDTWKTVPQKEEMRNNEQAQEQEMRNEQAQDADPIAKLDSLKFTIYKYAILLMSCLEAKFMLEDVYEDFADLPKSWEKMMSESSYLVMQLYLYPLFPLSMLITFLAFEGLRRKNLEKVLMSIKLLKIHLAVGTIMRTVTIIIAYYEGTLYKRFGETENSVMFNAIFYVLICAVHTYVWIYFTCQIRDILKAHQRARHTL